MKNPASGHLEIENFTAENVPAVTEEAKAGAIHALDNLLSITSLTDAEAKEQAVRDFCAFVPMIRALLQAKG